MLTHSFPINRSVGQSLPLHAEQHRLCASAIVNAKRDAVVVAELELGQIAAQVLLVAMLVDAFHAALEEPEIAFDGIGMNGGIFKRNILSYAVIDRIMAGKLLAYLGVVFRLIGHQPRLAGDVLAN